jgi:hypothetical protein
MIAVETLVDKPPALTADALKDAGTLKTVSLWILVHLRRGRTRRQIITELLESGVEEETANELVSLVARLAAGSYRKIFIAGILWLGVATGFLVLELIYARWAWLYFFAALAFGLGLLDCFRGWRGWKKYRQMYQFSGGMK